MKILDIHTHKPAPQPEAVESICLSPTVEPEFIKDQLYSVGIHPWDTVIDVTEAEYARLDSFAERKDVVAIGETGLDLTPKGGPMFRQVLVFRHHIELSERLKKPLVIHDVKAHDMIVGIRRDLKPTQNWAIHGFRKNPEVAAMLLRAGCYISFGADFNPDTVAKMPADRILAETDESELSIEEVITRISGARGEDMMRQIAKNTKEFLRPVM